MSETQGTVKASDACNSLDQQSEIGSKNTKGVQTVRTPRGEVDIQQKFVAVDSVQNVVSPVLQGRTAAQRLRRP